MVGGVPLTAARRFAKAAHGAVRIRQWRDWQTTVDLLTPSAITQAARDPDRRAARTAETVAGRPTHGSAHMPQPLADTGIGRRVRASPATSAPAEPGPTTRARGMRILCLLAFPAAVGLVLLRVPLSQNADGLLETIMSLQRVTLFYWGQARFANILPLLASPIRNPVANADAQLVARIVLGLAAPLFACALLSAREERFSVARATILSALLFLACAPYRIILEALTQTSPFGTSFTLAGFAVLAFRRAVSMPADAAQARWWWRIAGVALAVAAFLQNVSLAIEVAPLAVGLCVLARSRVAIEFALASALALTATIAAMKLCAPSAAPRIGGFGHSLVGLRVYGGYLVGPAGRCFWIALALATASNVLGRRDARARLRLTGDGVLVATVGASFVATALSDWVVINYAHPRYLAPDYILAASLGGLAIERIVQTLRVSRFARECCGTAAAALLLELAAVHLGPQPAGADEIMAPEWRGMSGTVASAILSRHLDGVAGAYWDVWPAIFRVEGMAPSGAPTPFGFAYNGEARRHAIVRRLRRAGQLRVGCIDRPGVDCAAVTRTTIDVPVGVTAGADAPLVLEGGARLTTLVVTKLPDGRRRR